MRARIFDTIRLFAKGISEKDIWTYAASSTFFLFLSLFPILILLSLLLPFTGIGAEALIRNVTAVTPGVIDELVEQIIRETYDHANGLVPLSLVIVLWSAAKSMNAMIRGVRLVYDVPVTGNVLMLNLAAMLTTLAVALFLILSLFGLVLANAVFNAVGTDRLVIPMPVALVLHFRYLIILALAVLFLTLLYTMVSGAERRLRLHLPGAVLASIAMSVFTWGFSVYVGYNQNYATIYGSFTAFVVMLLWAYACIYIVLVCGRLNRILSSYTHIRASSDRSSHKNSKERVGQSRGVTHYVGNPQKR